MFTTAEKSKKATPVAAKKADGASFFRQADRAVAVDKSADKPAFFKPAVQAKLSVSTPDDPHEKEADEMAAQVMRMPEPVADAASAAPALQRKIQTGVSLHRSVEIGTPNTDALFSATETAGDTADSYVLMLHRSDILQQSGRGPPTDSIQFEQQLSANRGQGSALPGTTKDFMESRFQADFSNVRIHTGAEAEQLSAGVHAHAFAQGNDIYFNQGKYAPGTPSGDLLLAHELTHTIQQGASQQTGSPESAGTGGVQRSDHTTNTNISRVAQEAAPETVQRSAVDTAISHISELLDITSIPLSLDGAKQWIKQKARQFAGYIPGYLALCLVLGRDVITGEAVERNGRNFLNAAIDLIPFGDLIKQKLEELGMLQKAAEWIDTQLAALGGMVQHVLSDFAAAWNKFSLLDNPLDTLRTFGNIFERGVQSLVDFGKRAATEIVEMIKHFLLTQVVTFIKEKTPAYPLLQVLLGKDPITGEPVPANGTTILNAVLELGGETGREQRKQMQDTGTFKKAADWIDRGIGVFANLYTVITSNFGVIWQAVSIQALMHPVDTFTRIYNTFADPVKKVISFVEDAAKAILGFIKDALLRRLSAFAKETKGYPLLTVLIGKDPFTNEKVPATVPNIIHGFMSLMDGGEEQFQQMQQSGAIEQTTQKINAAVARLNMTPAAIVQLFINLWNSFSINDLAHPVAAFQRIVRCFGEPIARLVAFIIEIVKIVVEVILKIMNFPVELVQEIIARAMAAFEKIKRDPISFLKNLLRAIKQGFIQFFGNIGVHLLNGLTGWLLSELKDANVPSPTDFSLKGIIGWVLQVLGITMDAIWKKLEEHPRVGPQRVAKIKGAINTLEGIWTFIKDVQQRGMAAIWDRIQEQLSNLWNTILDAVKNWVMEQIVNKIVTKLLSMLDPTGIMAIINSAIALYKAVQSFIRYLTQILQVINSFVKGVADIADGNIATAANYLENTMDKAMPVIVGFLANQVGLNGVGKKVGEMIAKVRGMVDKALTWLVNKAVNTGMDLLDKVVATGKKVVNAIAGWLGLKKTFTGDDGEEHTISFDKNGTVLLASTPAPIELFLDQYITKYKNQASKAPKVKLAGDAKTLVKKDIKDLQKKADKETDDAKIKALDDQILAQFVVLSGMVKSLLGKAKLNAVFDKYLLEGLAGTYGSMPKPTGDGFTADHQPQAAVLEEAAAMDCFQQDGVSNMVNRARGRARAGIAINLHEVRHMLGRTYGGKGNTTKQEFLTAVASATKNLKKPESIRGRVVDLIKKDMQEDVKAMRKVLKDDNAWTDLEQVKKKEDLDDDDVKELRKRITKQVSDGENIIESQNLDALKN